MAEMSIDERWRELVGMYGEKSDEELVELSADFDDLTEMAQSVLRDEMRRRRIWEKAIEKSSSRLVNETDEDAHRLAEAEKEAAEWDSEEPIPGEEWRRFTLANIALGGVTIQTCDSDREVALYEFLLERARIQCAVTGPGLQLRVPPDNVEKAVAVLQQGASLSVMAQFDQEYEAKKQVNEEGFELPVCKQCGSSEVMLESVEPVNQWACDDCGAEWQDAGVDEAAL